MTEYLLMLVDKEKRIHPIELYGDQHDANEEAYRLNHLHSDSLRVLGAEYQVRPLPRVERG